MLFYAFEIPQMSGFAPLDAGYTVSVRRTRLDVLVFLTLALAGGSPTYILYEGMHTPQHARSKYHTQLAKLSFDLNQFWSISQLKWVCYFFLIIDGIRRKEKAKRPRYDQLDSICLQWLGL